MRTVVLIVTLGIVGCAKPQPETLPVVAVESPPAVLQPVEVAPAPREKWTDPRLPARMEWHRSSEDPILRDLARGNIKAGDAIEPLIRQNPHYRVFRFGDYTVAEHIRSDPIIRLVGKGGTVRYASASSCIFQDEFIRSLSPGEWADFSDGYSAACRKFAEDWTAFGNTLPGAIGVPAAYFYWMWPPLPR